LGKAQVITLAHIINPVVVPPTSSLYFAQPVTMETMRRARANAQGQVTVSLFTAQYPEDVPLVPADFQSTPPLTRSILDIVPFQPPRKLPIFAEILSRLYHATEAEYLIYTNVDIGLQPHFYTQVAAFIEQGFDAFTINRRTISDRFTRLSQLPEMLQDAGEPHRGWDCFVFRRAAFPRYLLGTVCIGIPRADLVLLGNMQAFAQKFAEFRDEHLTFHIGNDRSWWGRAYSDYENHNTQEAIRQLTLLEERTKPFPTDSAPGQFLFLARHKILWYLYETILRYVHIPARFGRPLRAMLQFLRPRKQS
jgi:hypothetical protein